MPHYLQLWSHLKDSQKLDVFNNEPVNKEYAKKFEGIDNLILTPHVGGVTKESNKRVSEMIAKKIDFHLSKK